MMSPNSADARLCRGRAGAISGRGLGLDALVRGCAANIAWAGSLAALPQASRKKIVHCQNCLRIVTEPPTPTIFFENGLGGVAAGRLLLEFYIDTAKVRNGDLASRCRIPGLAAGALPRFVS